MDPLCTGGHLRKDFAVYILYRLHFQEIKYFFIKEIIENITREIEVGGIYTGIVTRIATFGAFVELAENKEGLLHISKISNERINKVEDVLKVGDEVTVKVYEIDDQGRINLTRKDLYNSEEKE